MPTRLCSLLFFLGGLQKQHAHVYLLAASFFGTLDWSRAKHEEIAKETAVGGHLVQASVEQKRSLKIRRDKKSEFGV